MRNAKSVLITGASSGLGAALALAYAAPGVTLFLAGRNEVRLNATLVRARAKGATVLAQVVDVTDARSVKAWVESCEAVAPLDLVIANAGISAGTGKGDETEAQAKAIFETNVGGVLHTIFPALHLMRMRRRGQIALMASLAGFRGLPGAPAYCASKAAVRLYGEALRAELAPQGVEINVICPGFIETPMTDVNGFPMPFLLSPERAAAIVRRGLARNKGRIVFPWPIAAFVWLLTALPPSWIDALAARLPRK